MAKLTFSNTMSGTQQAMTSSFISLANVTATAGSLCRGYVYEMNFGPDGAPNSTDCGIDWDLSRTTATGSQALTVVTPLSVDTGASVTPQSTTNVNFTTEPTITAHSTVWAWAGNQRAGFRWFAYDYTARLSWPATALNGLNLRAKSSNYTGTGVGQIFFEE